MNGYWIRSDSSIVNISAIGVDHSRYAFMFGQTIRELFDRGWTRICIYAGIMVIEYYVDELDFRPINSILNQNDIFEILIRSRSNEHKIERTKPIRRMPKYAY